MMKNIKNKEKSTLKSIIKKKRNISTIILLIAFILILILVLTSHIEYIDSKVYNTISKFITEKNTEWVKRITFLGSATMLILITILSIIIIKNKKIGLFICANLIIITVINNIIKILVRRQRPPIENRLVVEKSFSFPSGHSMIGMAFYGFLVYLTYTNIENKKLRNLIIVILILLPILIGISRIYLGVHYFSDVISGLIFSIAYLFIFTQIIDKYLYKDK